MVIVLYLPICDNSCKADHNLGYGLFYYSLLCNIQLLRYKFSGNPKENYIDSNTACIILTTNFEVLAIPRTMVCTTETSSTSAASKLGSRMVRHTQGSSSTKCAAEQPLDTASMPMAPAVDKWRILISCLADCARAHPIGMLCGF